MCVVDNVETASGIQALSALTEAPAGVGKAFLQNFTSIKIKFMVPLG